MPRSRIEPESEHFEKYFWSTTGNEEKEISKSNIYGRIFSNHVFIIANLPHLKTSK